MTDIVNLKQSIVNNVHKALVLQQQITALDQVYHKAQTYDLKNHTRDRIIGLGTVHDKINCELKLTLEDYFKIEKENALPIDFSMRKLYKKVK